MGVSFPVSTTRQVRMHSRIAERSDANWANSPRVAERRDQPCSSDERFLRTQDTELVPLGIGEHGPRLRTALPDVDPSRAESENPLNLGVPAVRAGGEVKVQTILHRFAVGHRHEADSHRRGFVSADDDLSLTLGQDLPVQHLGPEPGLSRQIMRIDDDVVQGYGHARQCAKARTAMPRRTCAMTVSGG